MFTRVNQTNLAVRLTDDAAVLRQHARRGELETIVGEFELVA